MSNVKESDLKNCITNSQNPIALELNLDLEFDNSDFFMNLVVGTDFRWIFHDLRNR